MEEQLIKFETAKLAKEKGFDWNEDYYTVLEYHAPTQSLLQKWLRDKKSILVYVDPRSHHIFQYHIITDDNEVIGSDRVNCWEEALEKGLQEALKLI